jgi:Tn3 transposase DDE domain
MGTVRASELMRSLLTTERPSTLARAIADLGRIPKTLHLLRLITDEGYRRSILTQLNRGEGRHSLAREVFHGRRGELRQRYREGQEDQLGALGLVVNRVNLDLWYPRSPMKGGHGHGNVTVRRAPDPPDRGARCDQSHRERVAAVGPTL